MREWGDDKKESYNCSVLRLHLNTTHRLNGEIAPSASSLCGAEEVLCAEEIAALCAIESNCLVASPLVRFVQ